MNCRAPIVLALVLNGAVCLGQASGSIGYGQAGALARAAQNERSKRTVAPEDVPPNPSSTFLEASVLMNVKADEYVAVFGVMQEGTTVVECARKMDATLHAFTGALERLGIAGSDVFVDYIAQNKVYGYDVAEQVAREKRAGFELMHNVSIHFRDYAMLDRLVLAASQSEVFDLIKVDYILRNPGAAHSRLLTEAARVLKEKAARYGRLMGLRLGPPLQVYAARPSIYYPPGMYDTYVAAESENLSAGFDRQRYVIQGARKSRTFVFNALTADGFDAVINPVVIEPVIQCTLYLKARYERVAPARPVPTGVGKRSHAPRGLRAPGRPQG